MMFAPCVLCGIDTNRRVISISYTPEGMEFEAPVFVCKECDDRA